MYLHLVCNTVNIIRVVHQLINLGTEFKHFPNNRQLVNITRGPILSNR